MRLTGGVVSGESASSEVESSSRTSSRVSVSPCASPSLIFHAFEFSSVPQANEKLIRATNIRSRLRVRSGPEEPEEDAALLCRPNIGLSWMPNEESLRWPENLMSTSHRLITHRVY